MKIVTSFPSCLNWKLIIRFLCINAITLALLGCTTALIDVDPSKIGSPPTGKASIFLIRPSYLSYAARDLTVTVNKTEIADLVNLSYTSFLMPAGKLNLSSEGGILSWPRREISVDVEAGQTYYLEWHAKETASSALMMYLFPNMDMDALHWEIISKESAQPLLMGIHYVSPEIPEISK